MFCFVVLGIVGAVEAAPDTLPADEDGYLRLGFDRLAMQSCGAATIDEVMAFGVGQAPHAL